MTAYSISTVVTDALANLRIKDAADQIARNSAVSNISETEPSFVFDSVQDTKFTQQQSDVFSDTLFVFTQQWVGIRQACGAFPVSKLAIDGYYKWSTHDLIHLAEEIDRRKIKRLVAHGMAPSTKFLLTGLKRINPELNIMSVWHGTMAGWAFDHELRLFRDLVDLVESNIVSKIGFLRRGMGEVHMKGWKIALLNIPPRVSVSRLADAFSSRPIDCLFASWNNQWKNMYTNLVGASNSRNVRSVYCYQTTEKSFIKKVSEHSHGSFDEHMARLAIVDLCLNVSINDCQPMTELESLSVGTPSLRPNLDHDVPSFKEYDDLFTINEYLNASAITDRIDALCLEKPSYLRQVIDTYKNELIRLSYERYSDFLLDPK